EVIEGLWRAGVTWPEHAGAQRATPLPLAGKTIVLTGTLPHLTRDEGKERLPARAARCARAACSIGAGAWAVCPPPRARRGGALGRGRAAPAPTPRRRSGASRSA